MMQHVRSLETVYIIVAFNFTILPLYYTSLFQEDTRPSWLSQQWLFAVVVLLVVGLLISHWSVWECPRVFMLSLSQAMLPSPGTFHALIRLALRDASMAPMTGVCHLLLRDTGSCGYPSHRKAPEYIWHFKKSCVIMTGSRKHQLGFRKWHKHA